MSTLHEYLIQKKEAVAARDAKIASGQAAPQALRATVTAEGRSGIRRIRIRDHQVLTDSPPSFAGYDLGPSSPELQLGVLGSCLNHSFLIQAAAQDVPIESITVTVEGVIDPRAGRPGHEDTPVPPHAIRYTVEIASSASAARIEALAEAVDRFCPILNLIRGAQTLKGSIRHVVLDDSGDGRIRAIHDAA